MSNVSMSALTHDHALALANIDLPFKARALDVSVVAHALRVIVARNDGGTEVWTHVGANEWDIERGDEVTRTTFIDRNAPTDEPTYRHVCDTCHTRFGGGYAGARCPLASRTSDDERCSGTMHVIDRPHAHAEGDLIAHRDAPGDLIAITALTWTFHNGRAYPTYTLEDPNGKHDTCTGVLCTRDLVGA